MTPEERRVYNARKQREYRRRRGLKREPYKPLTISATEEILKSAGHCGYCGMLLESDYHKTHPLVGCLEARKRK